MRITEPEKLSTEDFNRIVHTKDFQVSLTESLETDVFTQLYGEKIGPLMKQALESITLEFPQLKTSETTVLGPCIEGMGMYPDIDHNLKVKSADHNIYCLGDNTGIFRGIVPCMMSG